MATGKELKDLTESRRRTAAILMGAADWEAAVYMMALTLELALKSASCHALNLEAYPETNDPNDTYFKSHKFDRLLRVSGSTDLFSLRTSVSKIFDNWSFFTQAFVFADKDYVAMRYDPRMLANFSESKARRLYTALYEDEDSILKAMTRYRKW